MISVPACGATAAINTLSVQPNGPDTPSQQQPKSQTTGGAPGKLSPVENNDANPNSYTSSSSSETTGTGPSSSGDSTGTQPSSSGDSTGTKSSDLTTSITDPQQTFVGLASVPTSGGSGSDQSATFGAQSVTAEFCKYLFCSYLNGDGVHIQ